MNVQWSTCFLFSHLGSMWTRGGIQSITSLIEGSSFHTRVQSDQKITCCNTKQYLPSSPLFFKLNLSLSFFFSKNDHRSVRELVTLSTVDSFVYLFIPHRKVKIVSFNWTCLCKHGNVWVEKYLIEVTHQGRKELETTVRLFISSGFLVFDLTRWVNVSVSMHFFSSIGFNCFGHASLLPGRVGYCTGIIGNKRE